MDTHGQVQAIQEEGKQREMREHVKEGKEKKKRILFKNLGGSFI